MPDRLLTLPDAAARLAVSRRTLEREIADGAIAHVRIRGGVRIAESDVEAYIQGLRKVKERPLSCLSGNEAIYGMSAFKSRGSELSAALDAARPGRMRKRLKLQSAASISTAANSLARPPAKT